MILSQYNFKFLHKGLSPHKSKKKFCLHKILAEIVSPTASP